MPHLFDQLTVRGVTLRNRIGVSPMCQYFSDNGKANDWHLVHLGSRAVGGAALVMSEATAVEPRGRITLQDAGLWSDDQIEPLARITRFIRHYGAVPGLQLFHAGRKAATTAPFVGPRDRRVSEDEGGWACVAPSAVPFRPGDPAPLELKALDIAAIVQEFRTATARAVDAGYDWLELHGAHGYLLHSFLSPIANRRTDDYGGSFDNRIRFMLETVRAVRSVWPDSKPLAVRLSSVDWVDGGWTLEESIELARRLRPEGVDLIDASSGHARAGQSYNKYPGWQVPFAAAIRRDAGVLTAAVGMIKKPAQADEIVSSGQADLVLLAEGMLRDPYWPLHAAHALGAQARLAMPPQYDYVINADSR
jgi:2,4-dienoyl-CoA reductase-like NADH-dependent reductase (Old Yellow Enzyme family)